MPPRLQLPGLAKSTRTACQAHPQSRQFSTTPTQSTRLRRQMWQWINNQGQNLRYPLPGSTNYLGAYNTHGQLKRKMYGQGADGEAGGANADASKSELPPATTSDLKPFPLNTHYISTNVLNERSRELIWSRIVKDGLSVRAVSVEFGVQMSRVAAVVRLKEIEKAWAKEGKQMAKPYARAVIAMLPQSDVSKQHEHINDLPTHAATTTQIFYPTSESRHFTRKDAAKVFDEKLLPADARIPHPQMIEFKKYQMAGMSSQALEQKANALAKEEYKSRVAFEKKKQDWEAANVKKIDTGRWEFRFQEVSVDDAGPDGRGRRGTGWRYGAPLMDRKRGQVKIPTRVL